MFFRGDCSCCGRMGKGSRASDLEASKHGPLETIKRMKLYQVPPKCNIWIFKKYRFGRVSVKMLMFVLIFCKMSR